MKRTPKEWPFADRISILSHEEPNHGGIHVSADLAHAERDMEPILRELYPDIETFRAEEQRRFQLLEKHLDVPVALYDLTEC